MLDRSDPRAAMASYGSAEGRPGATHFAPPDYVAFHDTEPQETAPGARTWYARAQNFIVAYSEVSPGAELSRRGQLDEYALLLRDPGTSVEVTTADGTSQVDGYTVSFVPPGDSTIRVTGEGRLVRLFTVRSEDLAARCSNAPSYATPHPNVALLEPWPEPPDGFRLRTYSLDVPRDPSRFGKIFRCTSIMVNYLDPGSGPRDTTKLSPHSHDDFEQVSLVLEGEYVHHIRFPWTADLSKWIEDDHHRIGAPSITVIPPPSVHTSQAIAPDGNQLIDLFSPPRMDFSEKEGWVLNAADYPMPSR
ncbi:MAG: hypothetical protein LBJ87_12365 [bacterium]|nr:hypothetical protein [bacterium]